MFNAGGNATSMRHAIPAGEAKEWTVERDFINAVRHPSLPRPQPDCLEGIKYMRVVQAAAEAMERGTVERVR